VVPELPSTRRSPENNKRAGEAMKDISQLTIWDWTTIWIRASVGLVLAQALIVCVGIAIMLPIAVVVQVMT
jgi:hypothetical protein